MQKWDKAKMDIVKMDRAKMNSMLYFQKKISWDLYKVLLKYEYYQWL